MFFSLTSGNTVQVGWCLSSSLVRYMTKCILAIGQRHVKAKTTSQGPMGLSHPEHPGPGMLIEKGSVTWKLKGGCSCQWLQHCLLPRCQTSDDTRTCFFTCSEPSKRRRVVCAGSDAVRGARRHRPVNRRSSIFARIRHNTRANHISKLAGRLINILIIPLTPRAPLRGVVFDGRALQLARPVLLSTLVFQEGIGLSSRHGSLLYCFDGRPMARAKQGSLEIIRRTPRRALVYANQGSHVTPHI
jgi:hypothetical protein